MSAPFVATPSWLEPRPDPAQPASSAWAPPIAGSVGSDRAPAGGPRSFETSDSFERGAWPIGEAHAGSASAAGAAQVIDPGDPGEPVFAAEDHDFEVLGPLAPYAASGPVTDLFVNGARGLFVDRGDGARHEPAWAADEAAVRALAVRLIAKGGRHIDEATPAVDVRLGRGIRVHAVLPPVATTGTLLSIRIPRPGGFTLASLAASGAITADDAARLRDAVLRRENLLVTGAGGTGKTTLLAALLAEAPAHERIVVIEDVAELQVAHPHAVVLEARQANIEGTGRIGLDALLREALRMRPDRLVVGECRGAELRELLSALNTGHDGGAGTLHANSLADVATRLEALGAVAGMSPGAVARQAASAFDLVVHLERVDGRRRLAGIGRLRLDGDALTVEPVHAGEER
ncbi:TadA family conjugal transfer-associated ATPase [Agromyces salentinus]|uniref:Bacterial type II secretion system protein E domain-containing protein n=1 Tax=Agromyces salentinus TaxID=269421 RepID=A0ABN2MZA1_9MICO|nr:TadA family conjugal transfer-associated ATPase [Agromyces salentinus]